MIAISREKLAEELGVTLDTIRGWQKRHFTKGVEYIVIGKTTLFYRASIEEWLSLKQRAADTTQP